MQAQLIGRIREQEMEEEAAKLAATQDQRAEASIQHGPMGGRGSHQDSGTGGRGRDSSVGLNSENHRRVRARGAS